MYILNTERSRNYNVRDSGSKISKVKYNSKAILEDSRGKREILFNFIIIFLYTVKYYHDFLKKRGIREETYYQGINQKGGTVIILQV